MNGRAAGRRRKEEQVEHEFELHLAVVYRKLGVGSRTELALLLSVEEVPS